MPTKPSSSSVGAKKLKFLLLDFEKPPKIGNPTPTDSGTAATLDLEKPPETSNPAPAGSGSGAETAAPHFDLDIGGIAAIFWTSVAASQLTNELALIDKALYYNAHLVEQTPAASLTAASSNEPTEKREINKRLNDFRSAVISTTINGDNTLIGHLRKFLAPFKKLGPISDWPIDKIMPLLNIITRVIFEIGPRGYNVNDDGGAAIMEEAIEPIALIYAEAGLAIPSSEVVHNCLNLLQVRLHQPEQTGQVSGAGL